jgi:hypothetical protein
MKLDKEEIIKFSDCQQKEIDVMKVNLEKKDKEL